MKRFALLAAFVVATAELSAVGCNAILGNDPGTLLEEASVGLTCAANQKACGQCVDTNDPKVGCGGPCSVCESPANAQSTCVLQNDQQTCGLGTCNDQFGNCDNNATNGCETHTTTKENCGQCGKTCAPLPFCEPNTDGGTGYVCSSTCDSPNLQCNGDAGMECIDPKHDNGNCGTCGHSCTVANGIGVCTDGTCKTTCDVGDFPCGPGGACAASSNISCGATCSNCSDQNKSCDLDLASSHYGTCISNGTSTPDSGAPPVCTSGCGVTCETCGNGTASCNGTSCVCDGNDPNGCEDLTTTPPIAWCCPTGQSCGSANQCTTKGGTCGAAQCTQSNGQCGCNGVSSCQPPSHTQCGATCSPCGATKCCCPDIFDGGTTSCQPKFLGIEGGLQCPVNCN